MISTDKLNVVDFTPTPRTNQVWNQGYDPDYAINGINKDFAEKLERELNEANVLLGYKNDTANTFMNQVKKLQKENAELRRTNMNYTDEQLKIIHAHIISRAEWWRINPDDSHNLNLLVYVAMLEVAKAINEALTKSKNI